jgi:hypothetical protein
VLVFATFLKIKKVLKPSFCQFLVTPWAINEATFLKTWDPNIPQFLLRIQILETRGKNWFLSGNSSNSPLAALHMEHFFFELGRFITQLTNRQTQLQIHHQGWYSWLAPLLRCSCNLNPSKHGQLYYHLYLESYRHGAFYCCFYLFGYTKAHQYITHTRTNVGQIKTTLSGLD